MKKIELFILLCGFVVFIQSAQAQENGYLQPISVELKTGLNIANVSTSPPSNPSTDNRIGFIAGGMIEIPIGTNFYIISELLYVQAGYNFHGQTWGVESDYLGIPVMAEYKFINKIAKFSIFLLGGGMPAFKVSSGEPMLAPNLVVNGGASNVETNDNIANFDFSILAGGGAEINLNPNLALRFDSRYALSLTNAYVPQGLEIKGRNILSTVGLKINI